ncbi:MAG TPA: serine/threonine-protein kinase, partial [Polyangiaceae bacterium]
MQPFQPQMLGAFAQPGSVLLGKYRIDKIIGVGGMGAVVAARHLQLDERVAIKFLLPAMLAHDEIVQRFLREAKAAIKIRSEHCVRVLDVGTLENGAPYMVMEYLDGQDLAHIVESGQLLPIADAVDWVLQAAEALAEAHAIGIVHRDLKPANLFLTRRADGTPSVKVLDFGISKQASSSADAGVTKTQAVLGSPRYMSPEQMRSTRDVDARADVWALGAVIHELVAGKPPFDADTMTALCAAILQDPPRPIHLLRPEAPPQLEAAILGALEKDRDRRFLNVAQFAAALAPFGSASARASAERIARVLGVRPGVSVPTMPVAMGQGGPMGPGMGGPPSSPFASSSPMAATTGGSVTHDLPRRSATGAVVAMGVLGGLLVMTAIVVIVATRRHGSHVAAGSSPSASASVVDVPPPLPPVPPPPLPVPTAPVVLADPSASAAPGDSAGAAPSASAPGSRPWWG